MAAEYMEPHSGRYLSRHAAVGVISLAVEKYNKLQLVKTGLRIFMRVRVNSSHYCFYCMLVFLYVESSNFCINFWLCQILKIVYTMKISSQTVLHGFS